MNKFLSGVIVIFFVTNVATDAVHCRVEHVCNSHTFYRLLGRSYHAIVQFCQSEPCVRRSHRHCAYFSGSHMLEHLSEVARFASAYLMCIRVSIDDCATSGLVRQYGINSLPVYMLFKDGLAVKDEHDAFIQIDDTASYELLIETIEKYLGDSIEQVLAMRAEDAKQERKERLLRYNFYSPCFWGSPCWYGSGWGGCCSPWWGGCCRPGCGFGFGCGFGTCF